MATVGNGDYIYGKKRLREIDRRIRFLTRRLDIAEVVDPAVPREDETRIFFGAAVTFANQKGEEKTVSIVGVDEISTSRGYISWISPMARALIKAQEGDVVTLRAPGGTEELEILEVKYQTIPMEPFGQGGGADMVEPKSTPVSSSMKNRNEIQSKPSPLAIIRLQATHQAGKICPST